MRCVNDTYGNCLPTQNSEEPNDLKGDLNMNFVFYPAIAVITCILVLTNDAYAYIDPGTGSMILQAIIGAIIGSAMFIKIFWGKIKSIGSRIFGKKNAENNNEID